MPLSMRSLEAIEVQHTVYNLLRNLNALNPFASSRELKLRDNATKKVSQDIDKVHGWFFGSIDKPANARKKTKCIERFVDCQTNSFLVLTQSIHRLEFTTAKQTAQIIQEIIKNNATNKCHQYIKMLTDVNYNNPLIQYLVDHYGRNCSEILLQMVSCPELVSFLLNQLRIKCPTRAGETARDVCFVDAMLHLMQSADLIQSSTSFKTLHSLLMSDMPCVSEYLHEDCNGLFDQMYGILRNCDNFLVKKQLIRLIHDIITTKKHKQTLIKFTQNKQYLMLFMELMLDRSRKNKSISLEAWHVFKLFVANRSNYGQKEIHSVLWDNKVSLMHFLGTFPRSSLEQGHVGFACERELIIRRLENYNERST